MREVKKATDAMQVTAMEALAYLMDSKNVIQCKAIRIPIPEYRMRVLLGKTIHLFINPGKKQRLIRVMSIL